MKLVLPVAQVFPAARSLATAAPARVLDRVACVALALLLMPMLLPLACAVLLTSPGPLTTRSARIGADGRLVFLRHFRTTYRRDCEQAPHAGTTPVGWVLQRSGMAYLPVLVDVWAGKIRLADAVRG